MFVPRNIDTYKVYEQKNAIQKDATLGHYYIDKNKFIELRGFETIPGDIIVSCAGTIGESYVLPKNSEQGIINQALMIIRLFDSQIQEFYQTYFDFVLKHTAADAGKGTAIKNIPPFDILKAYPFPLPPIDEQKRIIDSIKYFNKYLSTIDGGITQLRQLIQGTKSKILELAMQGKLVPQDPADEPAADILLRINPKARIITDNPHYPKWICTNMGDICEFERGITFPSDAKRFSKIDGYIACLRTANVHNEVDLSSLWYVSKDFLKGNNAKKLRVGDILMSTANSRELVGRSVLIRNLPEDTTFGGFVTVLRTKTLLPEFFTLFLKYKTLKGDFSKIATQTTNIANLNTKILSSVLTPIPPLNEQKRIVAKIEKLYAVLDEIDASLQS